MSKTILLFIALGLAVAYFYTKYTQSEREYVKLYKEFARNSGEAKKLKTEVARLQTDLEAHTQLSHQQNPLQIEYFSLPNETSLTPKVAALVNNANYQHNQNTAEFPTHVPELPKEQLVQDGGFEHLEVNEREIVVPEIDRDFVASLLRESFQNSQQSGAENDVQGTRAPFDNLMSLDTNYRRYLIN